jgi:multiple antibiotic resistance protein
MFDLLELLKDFSKAFLPLLPAMNPLAVLPFLLPSLGALHPQRRIKAINIALITELAIGVLFLALGRGFFLVLGMVPADLLIAGGLILLILSLRELSFYSAGRVPPAPNVQLVVVPIGTPLLVGPDTVLLLIVLSGHFPVWMVVLAFLLNIAVAWIVFTQSQRIMRFLRQDILVASSKVAHLLEMAIAFGLIHRGITEILRGMG